MRVLSVSEQIYDMNGPSGLAPHSFSGKTWPSKAENDPDALYNLAQNFEPGSWAELPKTLGASCYVVSLKCFLSNKHHYSQQGVV